MIKFLYPDLINQIDQTPQLKKDNVENNFFSSEEVEVVCSKVL